jgi:multidrug resistance efflux pump
VKALKEEITVHQAALALQKKALPTALEEARDRAAQAEARARFTGQEAAISFDLRSRHTLSDTEYRKSKTDAKEQQKMSEELALSVKRIEYDRLIAERDRESLMAQLNSRAVEAEASIAVEESAIARLTNEIEMRVIRSPAAGYVGDIERIQVGSVVRASDKLGVIVPKAPPRAVALFPANSIGRIAPGQSARLRFNGFPWQQFGFLRATVKSVGTEESDGLIKVELSVHPDQDSPLPLEHGLPGSAEVEVAAISPARLMLRASGLMNLTKR